MKCDANCDCDGEATIFFSYIEDGKVRKVNLCRSCAEERGVDDPTGYSLVDMLQGMGEETSSGRRDIGRGDLVCEECGFTQSDFKKTGRFGCAHCYEVFNEGLENLLEAMHKNTEHIGKVPSFVAPEVHEDDDEDEETTGLGSPEFDFCSELGEASDGPEAEKSSEMSTAALKEALEIAISAEDYEEAARVRDQIAKLEREGQGNS